jgi:myo-inositol 2-dehydrogenase / D-chiro-inositol 1-dehydrogenase
VCVASKATEMPGLRWVASVCACGPAKFFRDTGRKRILNRVRVCFVGCGGIAHVHAHHLSRHEDAVISGCYDINSARAQAFAAKFNAPVFDNFRTLYDKSRAQGVYIAVPPCAHGDYEIEAANRGIHFFVEKPVSHNLETARKVAAAVRNTKVITSVGYCFRYNDAVQIAQQVLKGQAISLVAGRYHCCMPEAAWWRERKQSGGQIVEQTTHLIDLILYLCGPVSEVHAMASHGCMSQVEKFDVDDSSVLSLRLKTGAVASITSTCVLRNANHTHLEIITPERTVTFTGNTVKISEDYKSIEHSNATDMYAAETAAFIKAIQQGKRAGIRCAYADALKTLRVTLAASESMQTGMPVKL